MTRSSRSGSRSSSARAMSASSGARTWWPPRSGPDLLTALIAPVAIALLSSDIDELRLSEQWHSDLAGATVVAADKRPGSNVVSTDIVRAGPAGLNERHGHAGFRGRDDDPPGWAHPPGGGADRPVRRPDGARRRLPGGPSRGDRRHHRAERRREDHPVQLDLRLREADRRRHPVRRPFAHVRPPPAPLASGDRPDPPGPRPV